MPYNAEVFAEGMGALGAGLSGVGGIEGYRRKMVEELQAKAAMERLLKEAELKQQAEDNARAYQEAQLDAARREMMSAGLSQNELPTSGSSNADWIHAALNPAPAQMRAGGNPMSVASALMRLDPKAAASIYANERDNEYASGVIDTPAFGLRRNESEAEVGYKNAAAGAQRESGWASHQRGLGYIQDTRKKTIQADREGEYQDARIGAMNSLSDARGAQASLTGAKEETEDALRPKKVAELDGKINLLAEKKNLTSQEIEESRAQVNNRNDLTAAEVRHINGKLDSLELKQRLDQEAAAIDAQVKKDRAAAYARGQDARIATEKARQEKLGAETGIVRTLGDLRVKGQELTNRLTGAKADRAETDAAWQEIEEEQKYQLRLQALDKAVQDTEFSRNRALTEAERLTAARSAKGLVDARIKYLNAGTKNKDAGTALLQANAERIAYLLANPGMDLAKDISREYLHTATNPKASPKQRAEAQQQLLMMLNNIPGFSEVELSPATEGVMGFGAQPAKRGIEFTPQRARAIQAIDSLGAPTAEDLYPEE